MGSAQRGGRKVIMGKFISAICQDCDYIEPSIFVGGGKLTYMFKESCPAMCPVCERVVEVDTLWPGPVCPACGDLMSYMIGARSMHCHGCGSEYPVRREESPRCPHCGSTVTLYEHGPGMHTCPRCGRLSLRFIDADRKR